ncbi:MAG TPA: glycosyltransferase family 4 protein [Bryobacteraceae bacterium]
MPPVPSAGLETIAGTEARLDNAAAQCSVLVVSCDRYCDLWVPFFHQFHQYWPDCPFPVYLGANSASYDDPCVYMLQSGADESWSKNLKFFLSRIPTRYVLVLLEDFFLDGPVSNSSLLGHLEALELLGGTVLRLAPNPPPDLCLENFPGVGEIHRQAAFRVSAQPGIWNRNALIAILRDEESAWDFEHLGTERSRADDGGYYCAQVSSLPCWHVVERGKWFRPAARYYRKLNIGCDFAVRPTMSTLTAMKKFAGRQLRRKSMPALGSLRVALLTNLIPPYHKPVLDRLAKRYGSLRILLSTTMESNRPWTPEWQGLDVAVQKTWTFGRRWRHPAGFSEALPLHVPIDTFARLRRYRPDVVISVEMGMRTLLAALYRRLHRDSRLIIWAEVSEATERGRGVLRRVLRAVLARQADAFLAVGASGMRYVRGLGVAPGRVFPLFYTTDVKRFAGSDASRTPERVRRILYAGQLIERKGLVPFLAALSEWAAAHPERNVEFTIAGGGPLRTALETFVAQENLTLHFAGSLPYDELPKLYSKADVFVLPTLADTWGVVVNEALAAGLPVLGSVRAQAVEELVIDGVNGWTFDPDRPSEMYAAIDRAMQTTSEQLTAMRAKAQARAFALMPDDVARMIDDAIAATVKTR